MRADVWPSLPYAEWKDTLHAVHMWTQIVGKIRMAFTPLLNHWWNSTLFVTPRGLTTTLIPLANDAFQIDFDFVEHELVVTSRGSRAGLALGPMSVAAFYAKVHELLAALGLPDPRILPVPVEVPTVIPFLEDGQARPYDRAMVERFHTVLLRTLRVFDVFRAEFLGKASPVQFFWGGFDLASARFSGRRGPLYAGGSAPNVNIHVMHESYSHELIAAGFWPGNEGAPRAEYYCYAMPPPDGLAAATVRPAAGKWDAARGEFILPYDALRSEADPDAALLAFLQSTYDAAADLAKWDRPLLEERPRCSCDHVPAPHTHDGGIDGTRPARRDHA